MENNIICNVCGRELVVEKGIPKEDFICVKKNWGYFSKKDGKTYKFIICEQCADLFVEGFAKAAEVVDTTELL